MKKAAFETCVAQVKKAAGGDEEPADHSLYEEYVSGFDDVPILNDAVRIAPRRAGQPSFTRGERRDLRKEARQDGYLLRTTRLEALERLYEEYEAPPAPAVTTASAAPKPKPKPKPKRKKRRAKTKKR